MKVKEKLNIVDKSTFVYHLLVAVIILLFLGKIETWYYEILMNIGIMALILLIIPLVKNSSNSFFQFLRYFYPIILFTFTYEQTGRLNKILFNALLDPIFQNLDHLMFGLQPAISLAQWFPQTWVVEYMHFSYFTYYFIIPSMGLILFYSIRDKTPFLDYMFSLCNTFYFCYLIYIFLPVLGARLFDMNEFPNGRLFTRIMKMIYDNFEIEGAAFPSSHIAVALVVLYYAFKYIPKTTWIYAPIIISLMVSTVYCRYHYVIDVFGGILTAIILMAISIKYNPLLRQKNKSARFVGTSSL
jgi:membrane-associated phospholipid phosphatase